MTLSTASPIAAIHFSPWTQLSGAQRSLLVLVALQAKRQPTGVFLFAEGALSEAARGVGAHVSILPQRNFESNGIDLRAEVHVAARALIHKVGAGIVHCHSAFGMRWMVPIASAHNLKLVCHQRDNFATDDFHRGIDSADRIIAISAAVIDTLPSNLRAKTSVIYNAVDIPQRIPRRPRLQVGMAGRSVHEKGMMFFLEAVLPLMETNDFDVSIWGLWSSRDEQVSQQMIDRVARLDSQMRSRITLRRFSNEIETFFAEADIVVVPSLHPEPFGRVAMEAQAWGCVTIAAGHGGLLEIVEDRITGLLFQPGDADSLRHSLCEAINDPELRVALRRNARIRARQMFSPQCHYEKIQAVYESL